MRYSFLLLLAASTCLAHGPHYHRPYAAEALSAKNARGIIMDDIRAKHTKAINWWIDFINAKIEKESRDGSACTLVEMTAANMEVQFYLSFVYDRAGYYHTELITGWDKTHNVPDGHTYLSLSW